MQRIYYNKIYPKKIYEQCWILIKKWGSLWYLLILEQGKKLNSYMRERELCNCLYKGESELASKDNLFNFSSWWAAGSGKHSNLLCDSTATLPLSTFSLCICPHNSLPSSLPLSLSTYLQFTAEMVRKVKEMAPRDECLLSPTYLSLYMQVHSLHCVGYGEISVSLSCLWLSWRFWPFTATAMTIHSHLPSLFPASFPLKYSIHSFISHRSSFSHGYSTTVVVLIVWVYIYIWGSACIILWELFSLVFHHSTNLIHVIFP